MRMKPTNLDPLYPDCFGAFDREAERSLERKITIASWLIAFGLVGLALWATLPFWGWVLR